MKTAKLLLAGAAMLLTLATCVVLVGLRRDRQPKEERPTGVTLHAQRIYALATKFKNRGYLISGRPVEESIYLARATAGVNHLMPPDMGADSIEWRLTAGPQPSCLKVQSDTRGARLFDELTEEWSEALAAGFQDLHDAGIATLKKARRLHEGALRQPGHSVSNDDGSAQWSMSQWQEQLHIRVGQSGGQYSWHCSLGFRAVRGA